MKYVCKFLIFIVALTACQKHDQNNWPPFSTDCTENTILNTNIADGLVSLYFINGKDGYVTGANGGIYKTSDSAKTWTSLPSNETAAVRGIVFLDNSKGFAVGGESFCSGAGCTPYGGFILQTLNGGQTWTRIFTPSNRIVLSSICFVNSTTGFCTGNNVICKTIDGGQTWTEYTIKDLGGVMVQVSFADAQNGFVVCTFDKIVETKNGGATWEVVSPHTGWGYNGISTSGGRIYVAGQGKIIRSLDGGGSWSVLGNSPGDIYALYFISPSTGFAFGTGNWSGGDFGYSYGAIYCTNDGGNTWNGSSDIKALGTISSVSFPTNKIGYAISRNKVVRVNVD